MFRKIGVLSLLLLIFIGLAACSEHEGYTDQVIPIQFVEYIEVEGVRYLVIQTPDWENNEDSQASTSYIVYNTELGIEDWELTEEYNRSY